MPTSTVNTVQMRYRQITQRLNLDFYGWDSDTLNTIYVGSYGRGTAIHISDIDVLFKMPQGSYARYNSYAYNGQSQMLQDLRASLLRTYSSSNIQGDGQVTDIFFSDGMKFEIVPCFENDDGSFTYPDSNGGGHWRVTNPRPEIESIRSMDINTNSNLRRLCRMVRAWKDQWDVPMGGLLIDTLAHHFLKDWKYRNMSFMWYDWLTRDFFEYLAGVNDQQSYWYAVGSNQLIFPRGRFTYKAKHALNLAIEAIKFDDQKCEWSANRKWWEIYGTKFPC